MIQVKKDLTPEQIKQFSDTAETREFGIMDSIKRGARNLVTKVAKREFQAGVIYIKRTWNSKDGKLTFIVDHSDVSKSKDLSEVNNDAKELMKRMKDELSKGAEPNKYDDIIEKIPVKIFRGEDAEAYKKDVEDECYNMMMSSRWFNASIKL